MNRTCAIYDNNENYARRLMHAMSMKAIGIGDVIVTFIVILIKGTVFAVFSFTMATLLLGIVNFIRLVKKEISVKSEIPFVPYLGICAMVTALCM